MVKHNESQTRLALQNARAQFSCSRETDPTHCARPRPSPTHRSSPTKPPHRERGGGRGKEHWSLESGRGQTKEIYREVGTGAPLVGTSVAGRWRQNPEPHDSHSRASEYSRPTHRHFFETFGLQDRDGSHIVRRSCLVPTGTHTRMRSQFDKLHRNKLLGVRKMGDSRLTACITHITAQPRRRCIEGCA